MVLAGGLSLLMLTVGGFGGMINASYAMNTMIHNTQWVTGHFHLIFAGTTVIMYFAIAYYLWPKMTTKKLHSNGMALAQLWLWFIGMLVLTLPWHVLGLLGQPRRISVTPYTEATIEGWLPHEISMMVGGAILVVSALLFLYNLVLTHSNAEREDDLEVAYAEPLHPVVRLPKLLNGFGFWTLIILIYMIASYGYPLIQFFILDTHGTVPWSI